MAINYSRVNWDTTKYVNPSNMNQMDEGIKDACDGVDNLNIEVDEKIGDMSTLPDPASDLCTNISEVNSKLDELNYSEFDISKLTLNDTYISSGASFWANKIGDFVFFNLKFKAKVDIATGWTPIVSNMSVSERISIVPVTIFNSTIQSRIPQAVIQNNQLKIISNSTNQIKQNDEIEISGFYAY